jgi:hypothetical protein
MEVKMIKAIKELYLIIKEEVQMIRKESKDLIKKFKEEFKENDKKEE